MAAVALGTVGAAHAGVTEVAQKYIDLAAASKSHARTGSWRQVEDRVHELTWNQLQSLRNRVYCINDYPVMIPEKWTGGEVDCVNVLESKTIYPKTTPSYYTNITRIKIFVWENHRIIFKNEKTK